MLVVDRHGPADRVIPSRRRVPRARVAGSIAMQIAIGHQDVLEGDRAAVVEALTRIAPVGLLDDLSGETTPRRPVGTDWFRPRLLGHPAVHEREVSLILLVVERLAVAERPRAGLDLAQVGAYAHAEAGERRRCSFAKVDEDDVQVLLHGIAANLDLLAEG